MTFATSAPGQSVTDSTKSSTESGN
ncbi:hypothetical protein PPL_08683 [Heterostelium album PN500]|uniref:Uncharacterized protein n=1 Tax=Heterostelium pallidum (strain ATCC 26659 / Pp 5 / PN500) TaxID=670386 RepID=D3BJF7_HETP5|nr:hypothetical protein PPL_08683 [Heterostelium album PN500]